MSSWVSSFKTFLRPSCSSWTLFWWAVPSLSLKLFIPDPSKALLWPLGGGVLFLHSSLQLILLHQCVNEAAGSRGICSNGFPPCFWNVWKSPFVPIILIFVLKVSVDFLIFHKLGICITIAKVCLRIGGRLKRSSYHSVWTAWFWPGSVWCSWSSPVKDRWGFFFCHQVHI